MEFVQDKDRDYEPVVHNKKPKVSRDKAMTMLMSEFESVKPTRRDKKKDKYPHDKWDGWN